MSDIGERVALAQVASCTCDTKSPVEKYHDEECRYRLLGDLADEIERLRGELERANCYKNNNIKIADDALERAERAEEVIDAARKIADNMTWRNRRLLANTLEAYDKERDDE